MRRSNSGISPVVATVILVAIAIVIAIAVAFWASGLVGVFTRFEKIEITAAYYDVSHDYVVLRVKNTGSASATIDDVYVNGIPEGQANYAIVAPPSGTSCTIGAGAVNATCAPGQAVEIHVSALPDGSDFISGVTYEFAVHTASGKTYPAAVLIP